VLDELLLHADLERLSARTVGVTVWKTTDIPPHAALLERFSYKVAVIRTSLNDVGIRTEVATVLAPLIETVTISPHGEDKPERRGGGEGIQSADIRHKRQRRP
jgi:hypothetical protein